MAPRQALRSEEESVLLTVLPTLARMEAKLDSVGERVVELREETGALHSSITDLQRVTQEAALKDVRHEEKIRTLENENKARKETWNARKKWVGGLVATIVGALVLALLGLG